MIEKATTCTPEEYPGELSTVGFLVAQIVKSHMPKKVPQKFNPRPPGVIQQGSATEAVLNFLLANHRFYTQQQIMWATKRSHSAVSWALLRLRAWKRVEVIGDAARNSRYLRYRAVSEGVSHE